MPYPYEAPVSKHDLKVQSEDELSSIPEVLEAIKATATLTPDATKKICTVYSYPDAPKHPLSRALIVVGIMEYSESFVRQLMEQQNAANLHKCTIGVKKLKQELPERDKVNSGAFARFVTKLRRQESVAILGNDKYGRFGILQPMGMGDDDDDEEEKCALSAYIGDLEKVKEFLSSSSTATTGNNGNSHDSDLLWKPPGAMDDSGTAMDTGGGDDEFVWKPPGGGDSQFDDAFGAAAPSTFESNNTDNLSGTKRKAEGMEEGAEYHGDAGAAAADAFYSGLTRTLDTRSESRLFHMRAFNGWVKATQIQELNPRTATGGTKNKRNNNNNAPMRVLDLACGKGGDLGKWILHTRGVRNYVGIDVARGSLRDAAVRARQLGNKLSRCTFTCADLGADVPGRYKSKKHKSLQKLLTWSLHEEASSATDKPPEFHHLPGGGISLQDKFDVVSIQFAIHYMMQTRKRARRFFRTVSDLLEVGGNLIATTIDARIVVEKIMYLGEDLFSKDNDDNSNNAGAPVVVETGGACRITFQRDVAQKIFNAAGKSSSADFLDDAFGLEYTFTLVEGSDHASGVGEAVDLPEWLIPLPVLQSLAEEAGMELEYCHNFHEFFELRKDPQVAPAAHLALSNMKVLNRNGSLSKDEWAISRLYCAVKFRKVREADNILEEESDEEEEEEEPPPDPKLEMKLFPKAMMKARMSVGKETWESLSGEEKKRLTQVELKRLMSS